MAHFAEINSDGIVLRVVRACGQDIAANGGECSEQAAENFKKTCPLSSEGVKWIQTSKQRTFRKNYAGIGMIYDEVRDAFIEIQPFPSWTLNEETCRWEPPLSKPNDGKWYKWSETLLNWEEV